MIEFLFRDRKIIGLDSVKPCVRELFCVLCNREVTVGRKKNNWMRSEIFII